MLTPGKAYSAQRILEKGTVTFQSDCKAMVELICGQACPGGSWEKDVLVDFEGIFWYFEGIFGLAEVDKVTDLPVFWTKRELNQAADAMANVAMHFNRYVKLQNLCDVLEQKQPYWSIEGNMVIAPRTDNSTQYQFDLVNKAYLNTVDGGFRDDDGLAASAFCIYSMTKEGLTQLEHAEAAMTPDAKSSWHAEVRALHNAAGFCRKHLC